MLQNVGLARSLVQLLLESLSNDYYWYILVYNQHQSQLSLPSLKGRLIKYWPDWLRLWQSTFTCFKWQVTLYDSIWQVMLHSSESYII